MRGELVIVRAFGNQPLLRRLWEIDNYAAYITDDKQYQLLCNGNNALEPIGFPIEDVYKYDPEIANNLNIEINWGKLKNI